MARIAAVFPNDGSQYVGMGREFYAKSLAIRKYYDDAEKLLGLKIAKVCFLGPKEEQDRVLNAHLSVFLNDVAFLEPLVKNRRKPELVTGIGVGEIAALVAAECLPFTAAALYIAKRAELIQEFALKHPGASVSVSGLTREALGSSLSRFAAETGITHYLAPDVHLVWGTAGSIAALSAEWAKTRQLRVNPQPYRGPLFTGRAAELEPTLATLLAGCLGTQPLRHPRIPVHGGADGGPIETVEAVQDILVRQYSRPARWDDTVRSVIHRGFRTWVEVGPGKIYSSLLKKIDIDTRASNVEDVASLTTTIKVTG